MPYYPPGPVLATVATNSVSAADNTYQLDTGVNVVFEQADGDDILIIQESNGGVLHKFHSAFGGLAAIDDVGWLYPGVLYGAVLMIAETQTGVGYDDWSGGIVNYIVADPPADTTGYFFAGDNESFTDADNNNDLGGLVGLFGGAFHQGGGLCDIIHGLEFYASISGTGAANNLRGMYVPVDKGGSGNVGLHQGLYTHARNGGTGTVTLQQGIYVSANNSTGGGTVTTADGIFIEASNKAVGSTLTTSHGLRIATQSAAVTNYAIQTNAGHVVFNEGSHDDTDFRVEGATNTHLLFTDGSADRVGINDSTPDAKLDIVQSDTGATIPVVELEQLDLSEEYFNFVGTVATGNPIEAVGAKTLTTTHFIRVAVNGSFLYFPVGTIA